jgi:hypothetical protein
LSSTTPLTQLDYQTYVFFSWLGLLISTQN